MSSIKVFTQTPARINTEKIETFQTSNGNPGTSFYASVYDYGQKQQDGTYNGVYSSFKFVAYGALAEELAARGGKGAMLVIQSADLRSRTWRPEGADRDVWETYILVEAALIIPANIEQLLHEDTQNYWNSQRNKKSNQGGYQPNNYGNNPVQNQNETARDFPQGDPGYGYGSSSSIPNPTDTDIPPVLNEDEF